MSNYSIGGYRIAIRARSSKTLVVEGRDDRIVMQRVFLEAISGSPVGNLVRVDSSDIVKDPVLSEMGARDRVVKIVEVCRPPQGKLKGLKDREWDFFCTDNFVEIPGEQPDADVFTTRGHSIENYFFDSSLCCDFLKRKYSSMIGPDVLVRVEEDFEKILDFSLAYSVACKRLGVIDRFDRLVSPSHIEFNGAFGLAENFRSAVLSRGVTSTLVDDFFEAFSNVSAQLGERTGQDWCGRWWAHGHLGEDALWACVGWIAANSGLCSRDAETICHGHRDDRLHNSAHMMAQNFNEDYSPLEQVIEWAHG